MNDGDPTCLKAGAAGAATILWREGGTGQQWAVVRLGSSTGGGTATFPARLSASLGGGTYTGRQQVYDGSAWADAPGAADITITNVAETAGNHTSAIDVTAGPIVLVAPHGEHYLCDRPTNARYRESP